MPRVTSREFESLNKTRQRCILLLILLLFIFSDGFDAALSGEHVELQWTIRYFLKHLEYADDICLQRVVDFNQMLLNLERDASRVRLKINKIKVLSLTGLSICINGQNIEGVDQSVHSSSVVSTDGDIELNTA